MVDGLSWPDAEIQSHVIGTQSFQSIQFIAPAPRLVPVGEKFIPPRAFATFAF